MKHVLLLEVWLSGHHSNYLSKIASSYLKLGCQVTVAVSQKYMDHPSLSELAKNFNSSLHIVLLCETDCKKSMQSKYRHVGREIGLWRLFQSICKDVNANRKVDFVFLPYADYCLNAIGLLGSPFGNIAWGGICMRQSFHFNSCDVIAPKTTLIYLKRLLFIRVLCVQTLKCLFSIDELLVDFVRKHYSKLAAKLSYLPDPAEPAQDLDAAKLRKRYKIPLKTKVILIYGAIDERKGMFNLLDTLESRDDLCNWHVLVVGMQSELVRNAFLTSRWARLERSSRIHTIDEFVTIETEHHMFAMCDVVWAAYVNHYTMSGVVVRAGMYSKPVIACEEGLIGWYAREKGVGIAVDCDAKKLHEVILAMNDSALVLQMGESGLRQFSSNTWDNATGSILLISKASLRV